MPIWGWVCVGLIGLVAVAVGLFYVFVLLPYERAQERLTRDGQTVVARILFANPSLYDTNPPAAFEAAFVVFTRDNDTSAQHLAYLEQVCERLQEFVPDEDGDDDEQTIGRALATQRTVGEDALRLPDRVTGGREVYFSTPNVKRRMLPEGKLTLDYIYLRVLIDDEHRDVSMVEYPADLEDNV
jgi:hypothetical protein